MDKAFIPKFASPYNEISKFMMPTPEIDTSNGIVFVPRKVEPIKKSSMEVSYLERVKKENLRTYNG